MYVTDIISDSAIMASYDVSSGSDLGNHTVTLTSSGGTSNGMTFTVTVPATLSLSRDSLTLITATGSPTPAGEYSWILGSVFTGLGPYLQYGPGVNSQTHPNPVQIVAPNNPFGGPTQGGLSDYRFQYESAAGSVSPVTVARLATFGVSCYIYADELDFWNGQTCGTLTINGVTYAGTTTNPPGVQGTFCTAFLADVRLQGSGLARDGRKVHYDGGGQYSVISQFTAADGSVPVADQTLARDRSIIPRGGIRVDLDSIGNNLLANDTGGAITGYRVDLFRGLGRANCTGWPNPIAVAACSPGNNTCPAREVE